MAHSSDEGKKSPWKKELNNSKEGGKEGEGEQKVTESDVMVDRYLEYT